MHKHEEKHCPKCDELFVCKVGDVVNCQCNTVQLSPDTYSFLSKTNFDCLCKECLVKMNDDIHLSKTYQFPTHSSMFKEGLHYYIENGNWVFTEMYHMLRGYCCQSGCRHCVYGFKKI